MLQLLRLTSAPSATNVSINTAVCMVICKHQAIRAHESGLLDPNSSLKAMSPGISDSANVISLRPRSARLMSLTL